MKTLVIETLGVKQNIAEIKRRAGSAVIYGVLTGDAYGAGLVEMAQLLREEGIGRFAVSEVSEAEALRKAGYEEEEILMLRSTTDRDELERLIDLNVVCTIGGSEAGMALSGVAESRATVAEAHVQIDTGVGFGGFLTAEPDKIMSVYRNLNNLAISGIYTQIHTNAKAKVVERQLQEFKDVLKQIQDAGFETGTVHIAGSFSRMEEEAARMGGIRVGSALLGRCRRSRGDGLQQLGFGEVQVSEVRWLPKGHTVGKRKPVSLRKPARVAVLPVGYLNGFGVKQAAETGFFAALRSLKGGKRETVLIGGQKARVLGEIGGIETVVDVTDLKCVAGDKAIVELNPLYANGFVREYR